MNAADSSLDSAAGSASGAARASVTVAVVTSLYPSPPRPREGVFAERRWLAYAARGARVGIVRPVPFAPWPLGGERGEFRAMPRREQRNGLPVLRPRYAHLPGAALASARAFARAAERAVLALSREWGAAPDAIVADYAWPAAACAQVAERLGSAFLISGRGNDILLGRRDPRIEPHLRAALAAAHGRLAVSAHLARAMDELAGDGGTAVVPNGVDGELFRPGPRGDAREHLARLFGAGWRDWLAGHPLVLAVGHLIERKDPLLTLEAFARSGHPTARLVWIGAGPLAEAVQRRALAPELGGRVRLVSPVDPKHLAHWYRAADLLVLTSRSEGRPNVVLEALSSGLAVLATDAGGTSEWLGDLPECLAEGRDPGGLGRRIASLLETPPSAERCRAAASPFTWEASARTLEARITAALAARTP